MKLISTAYLLACCIALVLALVDAVHVAQHQPPTTHPATFDQFVEFYGKKYDSAEERDGRRAVFEANQLRTAGIATAGVTKFSDLTPEEFRQKYLTLRSDNTRKPASGHTAQVDVSALPRSVDYRLEGAVTPIPDQGQCSTIICAFGFATAAEGINKLVNGKLIPLSAQEGMACSNEQSCGCYLRSTFEWFLTNQSGRVDTNESYPLALDQCGVAVCDLEDRVEGARINEIVYVPSDESAIQAEVAKTGPVTVEVVAVSWQTYTGGVMSDCQYGQIDHVATVIGYTLDAPVPYWILKNWWGTDWGEEGYIYLAMGSNQCNMTHEPLTVHVAQN